MSRFLEPIITASISQQLNSSVNQISDLITTALESELIWVKSVRCYWKKNVNSTLTPDGITVIAAIGGGNWERLSETTSASWTYQGNWVIDPNNGNDENDGYVGSLATFAELNRRYSTSPANADITITIPADTTITENVFLDIDCNNYVFQMLGTLTQVAVSTISTYSAPVFTVSPAATRITSSAISNWDGYIGDLILLTSGAYIGAGAFVAKKIDGYVTTSQFYLLSTGPINPSVGNSFTINQINSRINNLSFTLQNIQKSSTSVISFLSIGNFALNCTEDANVSIATDVDIKYCSIGNLDSSICNIYYSNEKILRITSSNVLSDISFNNSSLFYACYSSNGNVYINTKQSVSFFNDLFDGYGIIANEPLFYLTTSNTQVYNAPIGLSILYSGSCTLSLSGKNNTIGIQIGGVDSNGNVVINWATAASKPTISGTTATIRILGTTNSDITWNDTPYGSGEQKGIGTLAAGTATISAKFSDIRGVIVSKATGAGASRGILEAPIASRTASQFVVNSVSPTTGALVNTDTSTFDWWIPPMVREIRIYQSDSIVAGTPNV